MEDEASAYIAITRLYAAYADLVTRRAWGELDDLFTPDAPIHIDTVTGAPMELVGPEGFRDFVAPSVDRFEFFEFVILNRVVQVESRSAARGRLYMVEVRQERGSGQWSNAFGVYQDSFIRTGDQWVFSERHYQSLARRTGTEPATVFPFPPPPSQGDG